MAETTVTKANSGLKSSDACLHHGVVLLADLNRYVWPRDVLRAVVPKGHLQEAPQTTRAIYVFNSL